MQAIRPVLSIAPVSFPQVVLIHGLSSSSQLFESLLAGPVGTANELVAIDLPGHGLSSNALMPAKTYTVAVLSDLIVALLQQLKIASPVLVGVGLGGHIAMQVARNNRLVVGVLALGTPLKTGVLSEWAGIALSADVRQIMTREQLMENEVWDGRKKEEGKKKEKK
jgi:pimeloyl-ACP methyl ester carboxylesterase